MLSTKLSGRFGAMNPFASEHDAQGDDDHTGPRMPTQSIRRKPVTASDVARDSAEVHEASDASVQNCMTYDLDRPANSLDRPSLRETPSADSLYVPPRTETANDVNSVGHDRERPQDLQAGILSATEPGVAPARTQDDTRHPASIPQTRQHGAKELIKAWAPEFGWIFLAVAIFVALVVTLQQYDNKGLPDWPMGLTLNTLVAFLATMCRSVIIIPIAEGLSQLKWNWFASKKRPVKDLYIFDQASRGPWGSVRLIFRMKGR